jgi:hypothetical protein
MPKEPKCPYCETPLFDAGDIADFKLQEVESGSGVLWMLWCRHCGKLLSAFPSRKKLQVVVR